VLFKERQKWYRVVLGRYLEDERDEEGFTEWKMPPV
jgi:hypothetical protein